MKQLIINFLFVVAISSLKKRVHKGICEDYVFPREDILFNDYFFGAYLGNRDSEAGDTKFDLINEPLVEVEYSDFYWGYEDAIGGDVPLSPYEQGAIQGMYDFYYDNQEEPECVEFSGSDCQEFTDGWHSTSSTDWICEIAFDGYDLERVPI